MVRIVIRLVGGMDDKFYQLAGVDPEIHVDDLSKKIEKLTSIPLEYQVIELRGSKLPHSLHPLDSINDFEEIVVKHALLPEWSSLLEYEAAFQQTNEEHLKKIIQHDSEMIADKLTNAQFFLTYTTFGIRRTAIFKKFSIYFDRKVEAIKSSCVAYFERANDPKPKIKFESREDGSRAGCICIVDDGLTISRYYVKTNHGAGDKSSNTRYGIDLRELFVYHFLENLKMGAQIHLIDNDAFSRWIVYIGSKEIPGFKTLEFLELTQPQSLKKYAMAVNQMLFVYSVLMLGDHHLANMGVDSEFTPLIVDFLIMGHPLTSVNDLYNGVRAARKFNMVLGSFNERLRVSKDFLRNSNFLAVFESSLDSFFENQKPMLDKALLVFEKPQKTDDLKQYVENWYSTLSRHSSRILIAFYYGWQMALLVIAIFPLAGVGQSIQMKYISGRAAEDAKEMENSGKVAMEAIENIRTVQSLTLERNIHRQFCEHLDLPHETSKRKAVMQGLSYGFASSIFYFLYAASFRFGLWLIIYHSMEPIRVLRVLFAISFTAGSLGFASAYFPEYVKATFAAGLIFKMLEEEPTIDGMTGRGDRPELNGCVQFEDVHFRYPERPKVPILQGLDIKVNPGETLALVGPSGCGKSTVVSLLERFYDPLDGSVKVDGHDLRQMNPTHLRSHIAIVSQEPILFDTSIRDNIVYGLTDGTWTEDDVVEACKKANIYQFISELPDGFETRVGDKGTQLSGGQKQRIAIARALIRNPRILLLDEATSALDTESEKLVQDALDAASQGRTCIVVAHRLSTVVNANCIMVVTGGKVIEKGTHTELMALRGAYWNLTQKQSVNRGVKAAE